MVAGAALVLAGGAVFAAPPSPPPASAGPEAYVRWVYGRYTPHGAFDSQTAYTPALRALFKHNNRLLHGEVGDNNDSDEICQCQDWDRLRITRLDLTPHGPARADARVSFVNADASDAVTLKLLLTPAGWRIDDVLHPRQGTSASLRAQLLDEDRRLTSGPTRR